MNELLGFTFSGVPSYQVSITTCSTSPRLVLLVLVLVLVDFVLRIGFKVPVHFGPARVTGVRSIGRSIRAVVDGLRC